MTEINQHEVGTPKDYAQQIILAFKNLEEGVSDFQGHNVMEDSEEEMMYQLIEEAINTALTAERERLVEMIKKMKPDVNKMTHDLKGQCDFERINTINNILTLINPPSN